MIATTLRYTYLTASIVASPAGAVLTIADKVLDNFEVYKDGKQFCGKQVEKVVDFLEEHGCNTEFYGNVISTVSLVTTQPFSALKKSAKLVKNEHKLYKEAKKVREECTKQLDALKADMKTRAGNSKLGIDGVLDNYQKTAKKKAYQKTYSNLRKAKKQLGKEYSKEKKRLEKEIENTKKVDSPLKCIKDRVIEDIKNWKNYTSELKDTAINSAASIFRKKPKNDFTPPPCYNDILNDMRNRSFNDLNKIEDDLIDKFRSNGYYYPHRDFCRFCHPCELGPACGHGPCSRCQFRSSPCYIGPPNNNAKPINASSRNGFVDTLKKMYNSVAGFISGLFKKLF